MEISQGRCNYQDGHIYEGEWKNNKKNGIGKLFYKDEEIYKGQWKDN